MARVGFIHDKLEIKFLILYIMARVSSPIDLPALADLALCDEGVDYFDFATAVAELIETEHVSLDNHLYQITEKGRTNGSICEDSLPNSVKAKCDISVSHLNGQLRRDAQVRATMDVHDNGSCDIQLSLDDESGNLFHLNLAVGSEVQAKRLTDQFKKHPEQIYNGIIDVLFTDHSLPKE